MENITRKCSRFIHHKISIENVKKKRHEDNAIVPKKKLTVQRKTLNYAVRSVLVTKGKISTFEGASKSSIDPNLFNFVDLTKPQGQKVDQNKFPAKILPINEKFVEKSIFHEIEQKFKKLGPVLNTSDNFHLISDKNLQNLIRNKIGQSEILNFWSQTFKNFLNFRNIKPEILQKITENQNNINKFASLYEIKLKFYKTPLSNTFVKRKIIQNCNNLIQKQNLGAKKIMENEAKILVEKFSTPEKIFPKSSYRTPENQRISVKKIEISSVKMTPAIFHNNKYIEINKNNLTNPKFDLISDSQKKIFLSEISKSENTDPQNLCPVFDRPKKPKLGSKKFLKTPFRHPHRRLNFSEPNENFDFNFLEPSPLIRDCNIINNGVKITPKRGLEDMLSPNELDIRRRAENVKCKKTNNLPVLKSTPQFKYGPNFFN